MTELSNIQFFQIAKKRPKGIKKITWVRRTHKFAEFNNKVKVIKMRAEAIDKKLVNY